MRWFEVISWNFLTAFLVNVYIKVTWVSVYHHSNVITHNTKMRRNKSSKHSKSKSKTIKCTGCGMIFHNLCHFRKHIQKTSICWNESQFSCDFCQYLGFDKLSLGRHIKSTPYCSFSNNQKRFWLANCLIIIRLQLSVINKIIW